jgi:hypothetical protein
MGLWYIESDLGNEIKSLKGYNINQDLIVSVELIKKE